jgi:small subunit ribosomal protein S21
LVKVVKRSGESDQQLLRRFRKQVSRSGVLGQVRRKRWFTPKSEERRLAKKKAIRRQRRMMAKKRRSRRY